MAASVLEVLITGNTTALTGALSKASVQTKTFAAQASAGTSQVERSVGGLGTAFAKVSPAIIGIGVAAAVGIAKGISATTEWAGEVRQLQRVTGQTAESASGLVAAGEHLGIGVTALTTGFGILSKNIVNGTAGFTKYGISVRDTQGQLLPFDDVLAAVADKFQTLKPGQEQAAFAMNVFGRSGKALIPILQRGSEGLADLRAEAEKAGLVMSQQDVDAAKELTLAQHGLSEAFKGAEISIGKAFVPALTKLTEGLTKAVDLFVKIPGPVKTAALDIALFGGAFTALAFVANGFIGTWEKLLARFGVGGGVAADAAANVETVGAASTITAEQVTVLTEVLQRLATSLGVEIPQSTAAADATLGSYEQLMLDGIAPTNELAAAQERLAAAEKDVAASGAGAGAGAGAAASGASLLSTILGVVTAGWLGYAAGSRAAASDDARTANQLRQNVKYLVENRDAQESWQTTLQSITDTAPRWDDNVAIMRAGVQQFTRELDNGKISQDQFDEALGHFAQNKDPAKQATQLSTIIETLAEQTNKGVLSVNEYKDAIGSLGLPAKDVAAAMSQLSADVLGADTAAQAAAGHVDRFARAMADSAPLLDLMGTSVADISVGMQQAFTDAETKGQDTTEALQAFAGEVVDAAAKARSAFQQEARDALTFSTSLLSDLENTAQQARDTLAGDTSDLSGSALAKLRDQAHLTAGEILQTFRTAAAQTRHFGQDLLEVAHIGGQAAKDLAQSLLEAADTLGAQVIADAPTKMQRQLVTAFGKSESAADTFSTKLTNAIVGPLKGIEHLLIQLAEQAFHVHLDMPGADHTKGQIEDVKTGLDGLKDRSLLVNAKTSQATGAIEDVRSGLAGLTDKQINVIIHTKAGSPWPDEALDQRLFDPMKAGGFRQINGSWTLPLDVTAHTATDVAPAADVGPVTPPRGTTQPSGMVATLRAIERHEGRLLDVQRQALGVLKDIRGSRGVSGSGGADSGDGGIGGRHRSRPDAAPTTALQRAVDDIVKTVSRFATPKEGVGVVRRVAEPGLDRAFIRQAVAEVRRELGPAAAKRYAAALAILDERTRTNSQHQEAAIKEALHSLERTEAAATSPIQRAVHDVVSTVAKFATPKEGAGVVRRVAEKGLDRAFIRNAVEEARRELGPVAARQYAQALHILDVRTAKNSKHQEEAIQAALRMLDRSVSDRKKWEPLRNDHWADFALKDVPKLPRGDTDITPNRPGRRRHRGDRLTVRLDRQHFDEQMAYEETYRGF